MLVKGVGRKGYFPAIRFLFGWVKFFRLLNKSRIQIRSAVFAYERNAKLLISNALVKEFFISSRPIASLLDWITARSCLLGVKHKGNGRDEERESSYPLPLFAVS